MYGTVSLCLQLSGLTEQATLRFPSLIKVSMLQHVFTHLVPMPLPQNRPDEFAYWSPSYPSTYLRTLHECGLLDTVPADLQQHPYEPATKTLTLNAAQRHLQMPQRWLGMQK